MIIESEFKSAWWLPNSHAQTIYPTLVNKAKSKISFYDYERLELPDGDFLDLAWARKGLDAESPLVVLLHGLGGSVHSPYVFRLFRALNHIGHRGLLMHFRGASGVPNRLPRVYHSGDTGDLAYLLEWLQEKEPSTKKAVVGISLGGNVLLKWLGEVGTQSLIQSAVAVSVPFQLEIAAEKINQGFSRVYQAHLLQKLQTVIEKKLDIINLQLPLSKDDLWSIKTLKAFDEQITAPLHGFENAAKYYQVSSSRQYLRTIATPTLIIHAYDDPFMLPQVIPHAHELSPHIDLELSKTGGHVGFIGGNHPRHPVYWLNQRIPEYLKRYL